MTCALSLLFGCLSTEELGSSSKDEATAKLEQSAAPLLGCDGTHDEGDFSENSAGQKSEIDCAERPDTGYRSGEPFEISVVTVDDRPVERETANAYWVMREAARAEGITLQISSGFRTQAEQQRLYDCYTNCNCNNCNLAARPGYSNHQSGSALDLNTHVTGVFDWLNANGARFGFARTVPSEPWHWEWQGGGPGGGPCDGEPCQLLSPEGGVVDDSGACAQRFGAARYWRAVEGEGVDGGLHWTNGWDSESPGNWARWHLFFEEAGEYLVEVSVSPVYGVCAETPYRVRHGGEESQLRLDQSVPGEWLPLGLFFFEAGGGQSVDVMDHVPGLALEEQHITADAVRLSRVREPEPDPEPMPDPDADPDPRPADDAGPVSDLDLGLRPVGDRGSSATPPWDRGASSPPGRDLWRAGGASPSDPDFALAGGGAERDRSDEIHCAVLSSEPQLWWPLFLSLFYLSRRAQSRRGGRGMRRGVRA